MFTKRILPCLFAACLSQLAAGAPSAKAASTSASGGALDVNFFYDNLKNDGSWFNTTEFGDVWQPYIAYKSDAWKPYTDGYWSYTDGGWMFVSYEDFGWAVYHYGRWTQLKDIGWAWVPGTEWAPAWVTWRESSPDGSAAQPAPGNGQQPPPANVSATTTDAPAPGQDNGAPPPPAGAGADGSGGGAPPSGVSQNYVGWAPLPPEPDAVAYNEGYAYGPTVDVDYGIDPYDYSFVDAQFFGAPYLGAVIFDPFQSYYCCDHSVNVSNFYYSNRGGYRGFYNGGPRFDSFRGVTQRPIPQYNINREQGRAARQAIQAGRFNQINARNINVAAPRFSQRNVRNGRVNFTNRGALPVSQVGRDRPGNATNNAVRERAQNTFRQQGEAFRTQHPNERGVQRGAQIAARREAAQPGNPGAARQEIATTPRAQQEEHAARQEARQAGPDRNPGANPASNPAEAARSAAQPENRPGGPAAGQPENREANRAPEREAAHREEAARRQGSARAGANTERQQAREASRSTRRSGGGSARRQRSSEPHAVRQSRGGGGGGGRAVGGGGGHRGGGGGGGQARAAGGGGGHGGGGDHGGGGGKKH